MSAAWTSNENGAQESSDGSENFSVGEIVTVQCGSHANLVGAHLWQNQTAQFSFDRKGIAPDVAHDTLFRTGERVDGQQTYLPRAVVIDLNGTMPRVLHDRGQAEDARAEINTWDGAVNTVMQGTPDMQHFDADSESWPDVLQWPLHPEGLTIVKGYRHGDDSHRLNLFPLGSAVMASKTFANDVGDRMQSFLEECDHPQGFQLIGDTHDGFSGIATHLCQAIRDDDGKIPILMYMVAPPKASDAPASDVRGAATDDGARIVNQAHALVQLAGTASLVAPMAVGDWQGHVSAYHLRVRASLQSQPPPLTAYSAGRIGAAVDSVSLAYRVKQGGSRLGALTAMLTDGLHGSCSNFAVVNEALLTPPDRTQDDALRKTFSEALSDFGSTSFREWEGAASSNYLPAFAFSPEAPRSLVSSVRGATGVHLKHPDAEMGRRARAGRAVTEFDRCATAVEMLSRYYGKTSSASRYQVLQSRSTVADTMLVPRGGGDGPGISVTSFATDLQGTRSAVRALQRRLAGVSRQTVAAFESVGFTKDEFGQLSEDMLAMSDKSL